MCVVSAAEKQLPSQLLYVHWPKELRSVPEIRAAPPQQIYDFAEQHLHLCRRGGAAVDVCFGFVGCRSTAGG